MEKIEERKDVISFLTLNYGSGYGYGYGSGDGYGYGSGDGSGYGYGSDDGSGDGILSFKDFIIHNIDSINTIIYSVHGMYAKGAILNNDLTLTPCYIAKCGNCFAHGETLKQAQYDARNKYEKTLSVDERIKLFVEKYPDTDEKIPAKDLFVWHNTLTGSCVLGRKNFCENKGIDVENDCFTINEFCKLTINQYGGNIIKKLKDFYKKPYSCRCQQKML